MNLKTRLIRFRILLTLSDVNKRVDLETKDSTVCRRSYLPRNSAWFHYPTDYDDGIQENKGK